MYRVKKNNYYFLKNIYMQVTIYEKNLALNDGQKDYITKKVERLGNLEDRIDDESTMVKVEVKLNNIKTTNKKMTVQVTMYVPNAVIRAEVASVTVEEGIDLAEDKLRKQIERYKTRKNRRDVKGQWIPASTLEQISATQGAEAEVVAPAKRKKFDLDPMHEEEAIEQLELLGHDFYAFMNRDNNRVNVVYRREDGTYGLLDFGNKGEEASA